MDLGLQVADIPLKFNCCDGSISSDIARRRAEPELQRKKRFSISESDFEVMAFYPFGRLRC
jgi:hypothetical protein